MSGVRLKAGSKLGNIKMLRIINYIVIGQIFRSALFIEGLMRFIILGDLHYSTAHLNQKVIDKQERFFDLLFTSVRQQQADYVFAIGDVANEGMPEELEGVKLAAKRNGVEMVIVTGNHDLSQMSRQEWHDKNGSEILRHIDAETVSFILLETAREYEDDDYGGYVWGEQLKWLKEQITQTHQKHLLPVIMGHHPLHNTTMLSHMPKRHIINSVNLEAIFELVSAPALYCNGHNHCNSLKRADNWLYIQSAAPLQTADFKLIEITSKEIKVQTLDINPGYSEAAMLGKELAEELFWTHIPDWKGIPLIEKSG